MATTKIEGSKALKFNDSLNLQDQKIINVSAPSAAGDVANKQYVDETIASIDAKASVVAASVGNVDISSAPAALDGVTLNVNDRILLKDQTDASENGIYVFDEEDAALVRSTDANSSTNVTPGMFVFVEGGTVNDNTGWALITSSITLDTTDLVFEEFTIRAPVTESNYVVRETPSGSANGSNTVFTLANGPVTGSESVFVNGILMQSGGNDYGISGATITFVTAPNSGARVLASYLKN